MAEDPLPKDEQLEVVCLLLDRDGQGAARLLRAYGPKVKWLLKRKLGDLLTDPDLDSVLYLAVAKAMNAAATFEGTPTLGGWFYTISHHAAIDLVRDRPTAPEDGELVSLEFEPAVAGRSPASLEDDPPTEDPVIADLLEVIEELGPKQKVIAKADLLVGGEADAETLAAKLGIPKQSVYSYRNKYKEAIRKRLEKRGTAPRPLGDENEQRAAQLDADRCEASSRRRPRAAHTGRGRRRDGFDGRDPDRRFADRSHRTTSDANGGAAPLA